ncbi:uncharacterized protein LOC135633485 [Musa acuminata AAA Group]|uniref:uncharacterized protein LOC135633485 n=1 Tax=Musa acuminata AAA Group TaxID=214697 RepID=UPI0031CED034
MSWLARSFASTLMADRDDGETDVTQRAESASSLSPRDGEDGDPSRGVKEDLSEITEALSRRFRGVASFLAPPPSSAASGGDADPVEDSDALAFAGFRSDLAEIGGRFRSGISRLSSSKAVSEFSKIASTFLPLGPGDGEDWDAEDEEGSESKYRTNAIGVTEEVMAFVRNISMHPETWLDFPLLPDDEESDDFDMSDAQQEHALAVERLAPRLAALRIELCPSHMSEGCFWKIYFVLLHPRLSKHDAELLSTPQVAEARALLFQKLQNQDIAEAERPEVDVSNRKIDDTSVQSEVKVTELKDLYETSPSQAKEVISVPITDPVTEKHPIQTTEVEVIDKSVIEEEPPRQLQKDHSDASKVSIERFDEDGDDWLEDETEEMGISGSTSIPIGNDEDVSFSDLEEEDDRSAPKALKK